MPETAPIGVFDSGYGGLTVLRQLINQLPQYDYLYLGDNARAPYGTRSFKTVHKYTLECVQWFFSQGCHLVILACNTASAKALRTIQQNDLPKISASKRVLGVIRPTAEMIGTITKSQHIGVLATKGTVLSNSYPIEINKFFPGVNVWQQACPMWVPLIENNEYEKPGADYFVQQCVEQLLQQSISIDVVVLACTHYPLLSNKIQQYLPTGTTLLSQGEIVAKSLEDYLLRHPEMEEQCSKNGQRIFCTTDSAVDFDKQATAFFGKAIHSKHVSIG